MSDDHVCRVCRGGDEEGPLQQPCLCSGTMSYVHESCLNSWLAVSKKDKCEVCGARFIYTKVYSQAMPDRLPLSVIARHSLLTCLSWIFTAFRVVVVSLLWLVAVPVMVLVAFRAFSYNADRFGRSLYSLVHAKDDQTALAALQRHRPRVPFQVDYRNFFYALNLARRRPEEVPRRILELAKAILTRDPANRAAFYRYAVPAHTILSDPLSAETFSLSLPVCPDLRGDLSRLSEHLQQTQTSTFRRAVSAVAEYVSTTVFSGQIVAFSMVVIFLTVLLLREWVIINTTDTHEHETTAPLHPGHEPSINEEPLPQEVRDRLQALTTITSEPTEQQIANLIILSKKDHEKARRRARMPRTSTSRRRAQEPPLQFGREPFSIDDETGSGAVFPREEAFWGRPAQHDTFLAGAPHRRVHLPETGREHVIFPDDHQHESHTAPSQERAFVGPPSTNDQESDDSDDSESGLRTPPEPSESDWESDESEETVLNRLIDLLTHTPPSDQERAFLLFCESLSGAPLPPIDRFIGHIRNNQLLIRVMSGQGYPIQPVQDEVDPVAAAMALEGGPIREAAQPAPNAPEELPLEDMDDVADGGAMDELFEDIDGLMEAIGFRGPWTTLIQHICLICLMISFTLSVSFWIPLLVGKAMSAVGLLQTVTYPILLIRKVSDPMLDYLFGKVVVLLDYVAHSTQCEQTVLLKPVCRLIDATHDTLAALLAPRAARALGQPVAFNVSAMGLSHNVMGNWTVLEKNATSEALLKLTEALIGEEPHTLGFEVKKRLIACMELSKYICRYVQYHWASVALEEGSRHYALAIFAGYMCVIIFILAALHESQPPVGGRPDGFRQIIARELQNEQAVYKVGFFIVAELILFPTMCGFVLQWATLPLFYDTSISLRIQLYRMAPFSMLFLTWLSGTGFMFSFSIGVDFIRDQLRRGVMWFVRDPNSPDFHPVREILEKPAMTQAKKILMSAIMYDTFIIVSIGVPTFILRYILPLGFLPLYWNMSRTFSFPLDILLVRFVVPRTMADPRFQVWAKETFVGVMRRVAHVTRLSHLLFDDPREDEKRSSSNVLGFLCDLFVAAVSWSEKPHYASGGTFRVPAVDSVKIVTDRKMFIPTTSEGFPLIKEDSLVMAAQIVEGYSTRPHDRYRLTYIPPHLRRRVHVFLATTWAFSITCFTLGWLVPLLVGRFVGEVLYGRPVYDVYAMLIGLYTLRVMCRMRLRSVLGTIGGSFLWLLNVRRVLRTVWVAVRFVMVFATLPFISAVMLVMYGKLTLKYALHITGDADKNAVATINVWLYWAIGLLLLNVLYALSSQGYVLPTTKYTTATQRFLSTWDATATERRETLDAFDSFVKDVGVPLTLRILFMGFAPFPVGLAWAYLFTKPTSVNVTLDVVTWSFLATAGAYLVYGLRGPLRLALSRWESHVREREYLIDKRLLSRAERAEHVAAAAESH